MALDPLALVSTAEARSFLGVSAGDKPDDDLLEIVINGLSRRIQQRTGRTYVNSDEGDKASARMYQFDPGDRVLEIDDCRELASVEVTATPGVEDSWADVLAETYVAEPLGADITNRIRFLEPAELPAQGSGWGALSLHKRNAGMGSTPWPNQARAETTAYTVVRVTAKWGWGKDDTTVPGNIKLALLMWLQNIHKRDIAFFSPDVAEATAKQKIPPDVEELLTGEGGTRANVTVI
jgi:hypothetical protein